MLTGKVVRIRTMEVEDLPVIKRINDDLVVRANVVGWGWPLSEAEMESWHASSQGGNTHRWVVEDAGGNIVGVTGLWDVDLQSRHALTALKIGGADGLRGNGMGTDAIMLVMAFAFYDLGLNRLYSSILAANRASRRAYVEKCGWQVEGTAREHVLRHGGFRDLLHVGILRRDFDQLVDAPEYVHRVTTGHTWS